MTKNYSNQKNYIFAQFCVCLQGELHALIGKQNDWAKSWFWVGYLTQERLYNTFCCCCFIDVLDKVLASILVYLDNTMYFLGSHV